jgi:hypothetical protein
MYISLLVANLVIKEKGKKGCRKLQYVHFEKAHTQKEYSDVQFVFGSGVVNCRVGRWKWLDLPQKE